MELSPLIRQLIDALRILPGVGPKSAQRMAFHLLERNRDGALDLAQVLQRAMTTIRHCASCRTFSETELCPLCASGRRDNTQLCIVESPADILAIEQTHGYNGRYFVLLGHLSPLDGIGPQELGLPHLAARLDEPELREVILATNPTVEGEATAHYIADWVRERSAARAEPLAINRIAHGVPLGGELEFVDGGTLAHAFSGRRPL